MNVGAVSESVTVQGGNPILQTESADVSMVVESKQFLDLPLTLGNLSNGSEVNPSVDAIAEFKLMDHTFTAKTRISGIYNATCRPSINVATPARRRRRRHPNPHPQSPESTHQRPPSEHRSKSDSDAPSPRANYTLKFGAEVQRHRDNYRNFGNGGGTFRYRRETTGLPGGRYTVFGFFADDTWKVTKKRTEPLSAPAPGSSTPITSTAAFNWDGGFPKSSSGTTPATSPRASPTSPTPAATWPIPNRSTSFPNSIGTCRPRS